MTRSAHYMLAATPRKPIIVMALHWLSVGLIVVAFGLAWLRESMDEQTIEALMMTFHRQVGLLILTLLVLRLIARQLTRQHATALQISPWHQLAATASHLALYGLILVLPVLGWTMTNAQGHDVLLLQLIKLPALVGINPDLADDLQDWHAWAAKCLLGLVLLHICAALWHHFIRRDSVLLSMLPMPKRQPTDSSKS